MRRREVVFAKVYLKTFTLLAEDILRWDLNVLEEECSRVAAFDAHLLLGRSVGDTTESPLHDEGGHFVPRLACFWIRDGHLREHGHDLGEAAVRYPDFTAVENVVRPVRGFDGARAYRTGVGTGTRFRQAESGVFAAADLGQVFCLLFRRAEQKYTLWVYNKAHYNQIIKCTHRED